MVSDAYLIVMGMMDAWIDELAAIEANAELNVEKKKPAAAEAGRAKED